MASQGLATQRVMRMGVSQTKVFSWPKSAALVPSSKFIPKDGRRWVARYQVSI
jgi:hypothetical protein